MGRPGIMLYFDILEPIRMLPDEDKGRLLVAILEYGRDGIVPEFDGMLGIVWSFIQPRVDKDSERYDETKLQREYAAFCKKRKRIFMPKILFEDWIVMSDNERQRAVDPVLSRNPTTTNNVQHTTDNVHSTTNNVQRTTDNIQPQMSTAIPNYQPSTPNHQPDGNEEWDEEWDEAAAAAENDCLKVMNGALGQGVVFLTDKQVELLLRKLDLEVFNKYVKKLADYIIRSGHDVADHYGTILEWWRRDCGLEDRPRRG